MTTKTNALAALFVTMGMGTSAALAETYVAHLSGLNEVPPNASPAHGMITAVLTGNSLAVSGHYGDLVASYTASHIHQAPAGVNGGVVFGLTPTPDSPTAGSYDPAGNTFLLSAAQLTALQTGLFYVNVHSTQFPGGEIRGQLLEEVVTSANEGPALFVLAQNYPNPFNPATTLRFVMDETGPARLAVHNIMGRTVATLIDGLLERGEHQLTFDAAGLPSGRYTYTLEAGGRSETRGMLLLR
jgi:hypothetical protein